jgi:hypothetical protein
MPRVDPRGRPPSRPFYAFGQERLLQRVRAHWAGDTVRVLKFVCDATNGLAFAADDEPCSRLPRLSKQGPDLFAYRPVVI